ncbi:MAG: TfuA-like protein [Pseudomonadota bacterium]
MIVFAGPSLAGAEIPDHGAFEIRPPAGQGDVYLATLDEPPAIGVIDGYFEGVPSVWHKEILWALSRGIAVLGASSMGALRAAELDAFGMIGVGEIYEAYRDGIWDDDDEVALVHGPAELGHPPLTVAMANVRATVRAAVGAGVITADQAEAVTTIAKVQFFKSRTWESILAGLPSSAFPAEPFGAWLAGNEVDQKQRDALALIARMSAGDLPTPNADFHFEQTQLWVRKTREWRQRRVPDQAIDPAGYSLLGELE